MNNADKFFYFIISFFYSVVNRKFCVAILKRLSKFVTVSGSIDNFYVRVLLDGDRRSAGQESYNI